MELDGTAELTAAVNQTVLVMTPPDYYSVVVASQPIQPIQSVQPVQPDYLPSYQEAVTEVLAGSAAMAGKLLSKMEVASQAVETFVVGLLAIFGLFWGCFYSNSNCEYMLAVWLIIYGSLATCYFVFCLCRLFLSNSHKNSTISKCHLLTKFILPGLILAWLLVGAGFAYSMSTNSYKICPAALFWGAFWLITGNFILIVIVLVIVIPYRLTAGSVVGCAAGFTDFAGSVVGTSANTSITVVMNPTIPTTQTVLV